MENTNISQEELDERISILKRFKSLLQQQRDKFREYLTVLENQQTKIENADADTIIAQTEVEQQILGSIQNLRKVINPMEKLYQTSVNINDNDTQTTQIPSLKLELDNLQKQVIAQNEKNRNLLKIQMDQLRTQLNQAKRNPYQKNRNAYSSNNPTSAIIDIKI